MKNNIVLVRGEELPKVVKIGESKDYHKSIVVEAFDELDVNLPILLFWGNTDNRDKMIPLLDGSSEHIGLTLSATDKIAGVMLKDASCPFLFVQIGLPDGVALPVAADLAASSIAADSATVSATVTPSGSLTSVSLEVELNGTIDTFNLDDVEAGADAVRSLELQGLTPATEYTARLTMVNSAGTTVTEDITFTTLAA